MMISETLKCFVSEVETKVLGLEVEIDETIECFLDIVLEVVPYD